MQTLQNLAYQKNTTNIESLRNLTCKVKQSNGEFKSCLISIGFQYGRVDTKKKFLQESFIYFHNITKFSSVFIYNMTNFDNNSQSFHYGDFCTNLA